MSQPILPKEVLMQYSTADLINLVSVASGILAERATGGRRMYDK